MTRYSPFIGFILALATFYSFVAVTTNYRIASLWTTLAIALAFAFTMRGER